MNRAQKRAKRMRARQHTRDTGKPHAKRTYYDKKTGARIKHPQVSRPEQYDIIEVPAGRRPTASSHANDPMKHGSRLDAHGIALKALTEIGLVDPNELTIREFQRLVKRAGGIAPAKRELEANLKKVAKDLAKSSFTAVDSKTGERVDPESLKNFDQAAAEATQKLAELAAPSQEEWDELVATAKKRKRGVKHFAEKAGFELVGENPKVRESWVKA